MASTATEFALRGNWQGFHQFYQSSLGPSAADTVEFLTSSSAGPSRDQAATYLLERDPAPSELLLIWRLCEGELRGEAERRLLDGYSHIRSWPRTFLEEHWNQEVPESLWSRLIAGDDEEPLTWSLSRAPEAVQEVAFLRLIDGHDITAASELLSLYKSLPEKWQARFREEKILGQASACDPPYLLELAKTFPECAAGLLEEWLRRRKTASSSLGDLRAAYEVAKATRNGEALVVIQPLLLEKLLEFHDSCQVKLKELSPLVQQVDLALAQIRRSS
jgi:hypothetical protein